MNNGAEWIGSLKTGIRFQAAFLVGRHFRLPWVSEQRQPEIQSIRQKTVGSSDRQTVLFSGCLITSRQPETPSPKTKIHHHPPNPGKSHTANTAA
ncbi:hypothetical protein [Kingella oralis]|uniref:hypothetical protein n=1 Tax=Kingella oralis TaxID=505 RepID=UPI0034E3E6C4